MTPSSQIRNLVLIGGVILAAGASPAGAVPIDTAGPMPADAHTLELTLHYRTDTLRGLGPASCVVVRSAWTPAGRLPATSAR